MCNVSTVQGGINIKHKGGGEGKKAREDYLIAPMKGCAKNSSKANRSTAQQRKISHKHQRHYLSYYIVKNHDLDEAGATKKNFASLKA